MNPQYCKTFSKFCSNRDYVFDLNLFRLTGYMNLKLVKYTLFKKKLEKFSKSKYVLCIISRHILWNVGCDFFLKEQSKIEEWQK